MLGSTDRIASIVRGLQLFSNADEKTPPQRCSVADCVQDNVLLMKEKLAKRDIQLSIQVQDGIFFRVRRGQMVQSIFHLLQNAQEAVKTLPEKWIKITAAADANQKIQITITDSGPGIAPAIAAKMMEPFFSGSPLGQGVGLGLSMALGIIRAHGGDLQYDATSPNTRFVITMPKD
jgi:C4-dicarboxylate-specific signal transduction histidine kinase